MKTFFDPKTVKISALEWMLRNHQDYATFNTWEEKSHQGYRSLEKVGAFGQINYGKEIFVVVHREGGGVGMGEYPAQYEVFRIDRRGGK